ncbi:MAG: hypothetical protein Q8M02_00300 [Candidatus Didemnitutus sp.]|nr:hypothetical protein [Candidatus Didemnitutus sp.]
MRVLPPRIAAVEVVPPKPTPVDETDRSENDAPPTSPETSPLFEDDTAPVGPSPDEEAALLSEDESGMPSPVATVAAPEPAVPLPRLEDLVAQIPQATKEVMDELFRAKFVSVRRVPPSALKL